MAERDVIRGDMGVILTPRTTGCLCQCNRCKAIRWLNGNLYYALIERKVVTESPSLSRDVSEISCSLDGFIHQHYRIASQLYDKWEEQNPTLEWEDIPYFPKRR